jgi:hypothetical protein
MCIGTTTALTLLRGFLQPPQPSMRSSTDVLSNFAILRDLTKQVYGAHTEMFNVRLSPVALCCRESNVQTS